MHTRAQIHEPAGSIDQSGEHVGGQNVGRKSQLVAVLADLAGRPVETDPGVLSHRAMTAQKVGLFGDRAGLRERCKIPDDDSRRPPRNSSAEVGCPLIVTGMESHLMTLLHKQPSGHQPEPVSRPSYQSEKRVTDAPVLEIGEDRHPELGALAAGAGPQTQDLLVAGQRTPIAA
jgi:hypothetical protein